jgi:NADPH:quinone reductase-like Zn-dependent oxidoreductase
MPGAGEVRIRVAYAGVNFADVLARLGLYPDAPKVPCVVGYEVSGTIDAVGTGVDAALRGQRVLATTRFGGYSDLVCAPVAQIAPVSAALRDEEAAALPVNYLTAHHMLIWLAQVRAGETVLVHGAAGGVGIAAVQLCNAVGARIIGTASARKHEFLRTLGVEPIDYRGPSWTAEVRNLTDGRGVDVALDPVGGQSFRNSYRLLAPGGRLCCYGVSAMAPAEKRRLFPVLRTLVAMPRFHPIPLMNANRGVFGVNLGHLWSQTHILQPQMDALLRLADDGRIKPEVDSTFSFDEASSAHRRLQMRRNIGKVLLRPV